MTLESRSVPYRHIFSIAGKYEGISLAPHPVDRSKSFNAANNGELLPSEYLEYTHFIEVLGKNGVGTRDFPRNKPTREDHSKLLKLVEEKDLDLE
jgi:hypothetical protein